MRLTGKYTTKPAKVGQILKTFQNSSRLIVHAENWTGKFQEGVERERNIKTPVLIM